MHGINDMAQRLRRAHEQREITKNNYATRPGIRVSEYERIEAGELFSRVFGSRGITRSFAVEIDTLWRGLRWNARRILEELTSRLHRAVGKSPAVRTPQSQQATPMDESPPQPSSAGRPASGAEAAPGVETALDADSEPLLVWVEAEDMFLARGFLYRVFSESRLVCRPTDSEAVLARVAGDLQHQTLILSCRPPAEFISHPEFEWEGVDLERERRPGEQLGDVSILRTHGVNEYTVMAATVPEGAQ
ncbi:hypothetical protein [Haliangium ochraceum]|uniref:Uncharacterized protein n=1 Tax=Haliangium ochraceum (strain DSM 14365 / JCM 11303 / SMP-2) TaxID=502025 RepID=D0LMT9_HALO1|nr:hypothetical protein [Haliangium ochraceum]ACY13310.1 hypothetical protein Hoch_0679 [Haliangium ochraceum DSM 14365]